MSCNNNVEVNEVNGTASEALPEAFGVIESNGTEPDVLRVAFDAFEGNFSYNNDAVQELKSSVQEVNYSAEINEVNGIEPDVLPVTFDAIEGIFSYKDDESAVQVQELNSSVKVNGIESELRVTFDAVEGSFSYKDDVQELELNSSAVESVVPQVQEVNSSVVESIVSVQEVNSSAVEFIVPVPEVNSSMVESVVPVHEIISSVVESIVAVQEVNTVVEVNEVKGTESEVFPATELELNSSVVESVVPVQEVYSSVVESVIPTNSASPMRYEPIEGPEGSNSPKSPRLSSPAVLNVATLDHEQSIENESSSVTPGNVGSGKLERVRESGVRRSPRFSPVASSPQTGGTKKGGSKLKRVRSSVDEVTVEGGNGSCEKVALTGSSGKKQNKRKRVSVFVGELVPEHEARERWGWRYDLKDKRRKGRWVLNAGEEDEVHVNVECHYLQANVNGCIFSLGDCAHIKGEGKQPHVGRIIEFFKTTDDEKYFRVQWFFRAEDTVMKKAAAFHDKKRLFYSTIMNDNLLECILSKVKVIEKAPMLGFQSTSILPAEYYCDMEYSVKYSTFRSLVTGKSQEERAYHHNMSAIHNLFPSIRKKNV